MTRYTVFGGTPLSGQVKLHGAKNAGFKILIASLLGNEESRICGLGLISEIEFAKKTISSLGGKVASKKDPHCLTINPAGLNSFVLSPELSEKSRFSIMYAGPLLKKFRKAVIPLPGGDISIGKRPLDRHLEGLKSMGVEIELRDNVYYFSAPHGLHGTNFRFSKNTHNGTEMLIVAACTADGETILDNAAQEPEIDDLINFLNSMGAQISRIEPRKIKITGVSNLTGGRHMVMADRNEAVTVACAAIATRGDVVVEGADENVLGAFLEKTQEIGAGVEKVSGGIRFFWKGRIKGADIVASPYPGFMTDWQPLWATLMTQADGISTVHETVYEKRFDYVPGLLKMGANIDYFQPEVTNPDEVYNFNLADDTPQNKHAIRITGPSDLHGEKIEVNDIRSGATALLAGIIASGKTEILDARDQVKRGYEQLPETLTRLGAKIVVGS